MPNEGMNIRRQVNVHNTNSVLWSALKGALTTDYEQANAEKGWIVATVGDAKVPVTFYAPYDQ